MANESDSLPFFSFDIAAVKRNQDWDYLVTLLNTLKQSELSEQERIQVLCKYCHSQYDFCKNDVLKLFDTRPDLS